MDIDLVSTDVLIIGGGPSGLSTAISIANEMEKSGAKKRVMLIEKGAEIGSHILSGAVIKPEIFKDILTQAEFEKIPFDSKVGTDKVVKLDEEGSMTLPFHPPYMGNDGNYIASLGKVCKYLAEVATQKGVEIYTGFAVDELLYENGKVVGAKTKDTGVDHHGQKLANFQTGTMVKAGITILAEGTRGSLAKDLIVRQKLDEGKNPQIYSLGVKELWKVPEGTINPGDVYHTFGYPLRDGEEFGGGFIYGLTDNRVAIGLVMGLDYEDPTFDIHAAMQVWKTHPYVKKFIEGGSIIEFGAKTLPEGGYYSVPRFYGDNFMIVGDSAGFLVTARLKGVHLAVASGAIAGRSAYEALTKGDTSEKVLQSYEKAYQDSIIYEELYPTRNFRQAFSNGMILGALQFGVQLVTGGACLRGQLPTEHDNKTLKKLSEYSKPFFKDRFKGKLEFDKKLTFDKVTDVFYSKANHDEEQIVHLQVNDQEQFKEVNIKQYGAPCQYFCPAEVYELHKDKEGNETLRIHAENCVHCKTCDIKSPSGGITWIPPYGGDGPQYDNM